MINLFSNFDFSILNDPRFKEDSVREELVAPLLWFLGFSATGKFRIQRSTPLQHPYVSIGSIKKKVNIYPDYLLSVDNRILCTIDAKAPTESIDDPNHLSQAYTYAIHREVRSEFYGLCNGHEIAVYRVSDMSNKPYYRSSMSDITNNEQEIAAHLSALALNDAVCEGSFAKDFGLHLMQLGLHKEQDIFLPSVGLFRVGRVNEDLYTIVSNCMSESSEYTASFDFGSDLVPEFLSKLPYELASRLEEKMNQKWPLIINIASKMSFSVNINARISHKFIENNNEIYCPLIVGGFS